MLLLKEFIKDPRHTGSVTESSPVLAGRLLETAGLNPDSTVLELGPGSGAVTTEIVSRLADRGHYLGLEINPAFVDRLRQRFPALNVRCGCAASFDLPAYSRRHAPFEVVVSGLPWASFDAELQRSILRNTYDSMPAGGVFVSFAYLGFHLLPGGRLFQTLLSETFSTVSRTTPVLRNFPPAFVYVCRK